MVAGVWTGVGFSNLKNSRSRTRIQKFQNRNGVGVWKTDTGHLWFGCKQAQQSVKYINWVLSELSVGLHETLNRIRRTCISLSHRGGQPLLCKKRRYCYHPLLNLVVVLPQSFLNKNSSELSPVAKLTGGKGGRPPPLAGHFEVFGPPVTTLFILLSDL